PTTLEVLLGANSVADLLRLSDAEDAISREVAAVADAATKAKRRLAERVRAGADHADRGAGARAPGAARGGSTRATRSGGGESTRGGGGRRTCARARRAACTGAGRCRRRSRGRPTSTGRAAGAGGRGSGGDHGRAGDVDGERPTAAAGAG